MVLARRAQIRRRHDSVRHAAGPDAAPPHPLADQRDFFGMHVAPWVFACCNAIRSCPIANYYRRVAEFTEFFMAIERDSFAIE